MKVHVIEPGLLTSVQDFGRTGLMAQGISQGGAVDKFSLQLANWLVNKPLDSAALEITLTGPKLEFSEATSVALTGAECEVTINHIPAPPHETWQINKGDILHIKRLKSGARAYLAISAEFDLPSVLDSYATHFTGSFGGYFGRQLAANDQIFFSKPTQIARKVLPKNYHPFYSGNYQVRCVAGPEFEWFSPRSIQTFFNNPFRVSAHLNRTGVRLQCEDLQLHPMPELISSGVIEGTIQLPPSGAPIIALAECQTIGGYHRIANVISADFGLLGQLRPFDKVSFCLISQSFAEQLKHESAYMLQILNES